jgi:hypothetical protein
MSGTAIQIGNGPNMRRLLEADGLEDVRAAVVGGPGDPEVWEVSARLENVSPAIDDAGRGSDLEAAAASLAAAVALHFPQRSAATTSAIIDDEE